MRYAETYRIGSLVAPLATNFPQIRDFPLGCPMALGRLGFSGLSAAASTCALALGHTAPCPAFAAIA